jgi:hypothetical protein
LKNDPGGGKEAVERKQGGKQKEKKHRRVLEAGVPWGGGGELRWKGVLHACHWRDSVKVTKQIFSIMTAAGEVLVERTPT